jgi:hypothetical protein
MRFPDVKALDRISEASKEDFLSQAGTHFQLLTARLLTYGYDVRDRLGEARFYRSPAI